MDVNLRVGHKLASGFRKGNLPDLEAMHLRSLRIIPSCVHGVFEIGSVICAHGKDNVCLFGFSLARRPQDYILHANITAIAEDTVVPVAWLELGLGLSASVKCQWPG